MKARYLAYILQGTGRYIQGSFFQGGSLTRVYMSVYYNLIIHHIFNMKKVSALLAIGALAISGITVTYGAGAPDQHAETEAELQQAEGRLNNIISEAKTRELKDIALFDDSKITDRTQRQLLKQRKSDRSQYLQNIKTLKDFQSEESIDKTIQSLETKGYPVDVAFAVLCREIESYKKTNPEAEPKMIVRHFNTEAGLQEKESGGDIVSLSFGVPAFAYTISYSAWTSLTTSEKLLVASNPSAALKTKSIQKVAYDYTTQKFGSNGLGDKSDGYRHGIWNALMTRDISRTWAEAIATAHEDRPQTELNSKQADGYYGWQHKNMDLNNNKVGRGVIAWYEYSVNCSDATVKSRISAKLTNTSGSITWLHN